ncbi:MAG: hypothetical protein QOG90_2080 [Actinomycetota bacterium]|jgi:hypothetical protein
MKFSPARIVAVLVAVVAVVSASCDSGAHKSDDATRSFGRSGERIVVTSTDTAHPAISHAAARRVFDHPLTEPAATDIHVVFDGIGTLHAVGIPDASGSLTNPPLAARATVPVSSLEGHTVWIRVWKAEVGAHSCPAQPVSVPPGKVLVNPPRHIPFYSAVVVDATTGVEADWTQSLTTPICPTVRDR